MAKKRQLKKKNNMLADMAAANKEELAGKAGEETTEKEHAPSANVYVQFGGNEYSQKDIIERIKKTWEEGGRLIDDIKTLDVYIKPEERRVYYKINGEMSSSIAL